MLFLAQFLNSEVVDSAQHTVGTLVDLLATNTETGYAPITAIVVKESGTKLQRVIPFSYVVNLSKDEIILKTLLKNVERRDVMPNDIFLYRDILDKQIVDMEDRRVVRVNDLQFGVISNKPHILGIDVSTRGIFRRVGVDRFPPFSWLKPKFIDWQKVQVVGGSLKLTTLSKELIKLHAADLADIIEDLNPKQSETLMKSLDTDTAAKVFEELDDEFRHYVMKLLDPKRAGFILSRLPIDELVDYLGSLPKKESKKLMGSLDDVKKKAVQKFLQYEEDTAGGLMTTEVVRGEANWTVEKTIDYIRKVSESFRSINFVYIIDDNNVLIGVVSLRALIISEPEEKMKNIMKMIKENQTVTADTEAEEVAEMMTKYNLSSVAVIDEKQRFLGVITVDDVMQHLVPDA